MMRTPLTPETHRRKVFELRFPPTTVGDARMIAINRAIVKTLENPIVARAVANNLRSTAT